MTDKAIKEPRTRTPEEKVLIGVIQQAMEVTRDELRFAIRRLELKL